MDRAEVHSWNPITLNYKERVEREGKWVKAITLKGDDALFNW